MPDAPKSSDELDSVGRDEAGLDEVGLAVLTACQQRGALTARAIDQLIAPLVATSGALTRLSAAGLLREAAGEFAITDDGLRHLDLIIEGIQAEFTPDDPAYVSRYRREKPSLPFEANTIWAEAVCINIRLDPAALKPLIPRYFELDLYDGHAYVSVTASRLKNFGAGAVPNLFRTNFYQATYRAHVTYTDFRGRRTRGCYFVRSDTNSAIMSLTANLLPEFKAHHCGTCPMLMARNGDQFVLTVDPPEDPSGRVVLVIDTGRDLDRMPASSRFRSVDDAYEYIVDFHDAFSFDPETGEVFILRIDRGDWQIKIVEPTDYYLGYVSEGPFPAGSAALDSVFYFRNTPYRWLPLLKERVRAVRP